ncbi:MAG: ROK family protein, partial [Clostridia bacterium]|nr:ROK family protein [Clostridia bacterium]
MQISKLCPEFKDYVWGGDNLIKSYGKNCKTIPCAESWELSFHKDGLTKLENGKTLEECVTSEDLGENVKDFSFFPMLIKFIDAKQNLSIQVHPSDEYALKNENSFGKTETWYIVSAEEGAGIYLGFKNNVTKQEYESAIKENRLTDLLNFYSVKAGECYFIPSGTVHAIGNGCLICEIQQNSNLTYRVYDYGRVDKTGKQRELHVEKALQVSNLNKHENVCLNGETIAVSKYFTVKKLGVKNAVLAPKNSFQCVTCVSGNGTIDGQIISKGDSFFVPANHKEYILDGDMEVLVSEVRKYYVGIDLGGTFIKGGIVDDLGNILVSNKVPTESKKGDKAVALNIANLVKSLLKSANLTESDVVGVGIGVPGMIDSKNGEVIYSNNLDWYDFKISSEVERLTCLPIKIANDANVAALGETKFGSGKNYNNTVLITLGTGVGGGIILNGKIFSGGLNDAGGEIGHTVIGAGGRQCSCGRRGCWEA